MPKKTNLYGAKETKAQKTALALNWPKALWERVILASIFITCIGLIVFKVPANASTPGHISPMLKPANGRKAKTIFIDVECSKVADGSEVFRVSGRAGGRCWVPFPEQNASVLKFVFKDEGTAAQRMANSNNPVVMRNNCAFFPRHCEINIAKNWHAGIYTVSLKMQSKRPPVWHFNKEGCFFEVLLGKKRVQQLESEEDAYANQSFSNAAEAQSLKQQESIKLEVKKQGEAPNQNTSQNPNQNTSQTKITTLLPAQRPSSLRVANQNNNNQGQSVQTGALKNRLIVVVKKATPPEENTQFVAQQESQKQSTNQPKHQPASSPSSGGSIKEELEKAPTWKNAQEQKQRQAQNANNEGIIGEKRTQESKAEKVIMPAKNPFEIPKKLSTLIQASEKPLSGGLESASFNFKLVVRKPATIRGGVVLVKSLDSSEPYQIETPSATKAMESQINRAIGVDSGKNETPTQAPEKKDWSHLRGDGFKIESIAKGVENSITAIGSVGTEAQKIVQQINWSEVKGIVAKSAKITSPISSQRAAFREGQMGLVDQIIEFLNHDPEKRRVARSSIIVVDPAHGGEDSGVSVNGQKEKDITLIMAKKIKQKLSSLGFNVLLTREDDILVDAGQRIAAIERTRPNLVISLHVNNSPDPSEGGASVHIVPPEGVSFARPEEKQKQTQQGSYKQQKQKPYEASKSMFESISRLLAQKRIRIDRKAFPMEDLYVLAKSNAPGVLIELGHLSNEEDGQLLSQAEFLDMLADSISRSAMVTITGSEKEVF